MADQDDVRRIALGLPDAHEADNGFHFGVGGKSFAWVWLERHTPRAARVPNPGVLAVRVANQNDKEALLDLDEDVFFTEPHYDGYPAVLGRLDRTDDELLARILTDAWRCRAPKGLVRAFDASAAPSSEPRPDDAPG